MQVECAPNSSLHALFEKLEVIVLLNENPLLIPARLDTSSASSRIHDALMLCE